MSKTNTEYGWAFEIGAGYEVEVQITVRYDESHVDVDGFALDEAATNAVGFVHEQAVQQRDDD